MKTIIQVSFNEDSNRYHIHAGEGTSVDECAFACAVVARVFTKSKFISSTAEFETMIHKYLTDPQFEEVTEEDEEEDKADGTAE